MTTPPDPQAQPGPATPPPAPPAQAPAAAVAPAATVEVGANRPQSLASATAAWVVQSGSVDLFAVPWQDGAPAGARHFLVEAGQGSLLLGHDPAEGLGLLATGRPGTVLHPLDRQELLAALADPVTRAPTLGLVEGWIGTMAQAYRHPSGTSSDATLEPGPFDADAGLSAEGASQLLWIGVTQGGLILSNRADITAGPGEPPLPVSRGDTVTTTAASQGTVQTTDDLLGPDNAGFSAVDAFTSRVLAAVAADLAAAMADDRHRFEESGAADARRMERALTDVASVLDHEAPVLPDDLGASPTVRLLAACQFIGPANGITFRAPAPSVAGLAAKDPIAAIAVSSQVRYRQVTLPFEWWKGDHGPMLAFRLPAEASPHPDAAPAHPEDAPAEGAQLQSTDPKTAPNAAAPDLTEPVALVPASRSSYDLVDPATGTRTRVNAATAAGLQPIAVTFYRPFPARPISARTMLGFGVSSSKGDLWRIGLFGAGSAVLSLLTPILTGVLFNSIIPSGSLTLLAQAGVALLVAAIAAGLFLLGQNLAILRLSGMMSYDLQAAVWDRLLALPAPFFRQFSSGDLVARALGVDAIRQIVSGVTVSSLLGVVFSVFSLALLFFYSVPLALVAVGIVAVVSAITVWLGLIQVRYNRMMYREVGDIYGILYQYLESIDKLKVTGAESRAFARWAEKFRAQKRYSFSSSLAANGLTTVNAVLGVTSSIVLFALVGQGFGDLSDASFLAFSAAYGQFVVAVQQVNYSVVAILSVIPLYERLKPILESLPEFDDTKADPGVLTGTVSVDQLTFSYAPGLPNVLDGVSFSARPGEIIAIAGPSGCGKTSLIRLLLGFEQPTGGSITYDNQDLSMVDVRSVRRQTGVVLQNGSTMSGNIFNNIVGASQLGMDEAWAAAEMAGIADDIKAMPMGMFTYVPVGGGTFSGGQIQRILLARALVTRPRILLMDEATSALDNVTQAHVMQSIRSLRSTVIIAAERLSTLKSADRIVVLDEGKVVEHGTYDELLQAGGLFAKMAQRQLM